MTSSRPEDLVLVLFGASGDLAKRKLLPGLFHLMRAGLMPDRFAIIGTSRHPISDEEFRSLAHDAVQEFGREEITEESWSPFAQALSYVGSQAGEMDDLVAAVARAQERIGGPSRRLLYLSVPPGASGAIVESLGESGLSENARAILEKPFGADLESARELNEQVHRVFDEDAVFRIDHFLGKEAVQNLLVLRFANGMFEPIWNREHVDHVQIDVPEKLSIEGRASFYESTGAFRDMIVTHLFQLLGFVAMEPPEELAARPLGRERLKVFQSIKALAPQDIVRGQYVGYHEEEGVDAHSDVETFVAVRVTIENERWRGVPFFLRTGKNLPESRQVVTLALREPARQMFAATEQARGAQVQDRYVFELDGPGRISARFLTKQPGTSLELAPAHMDFSYADQFPDASGLEAYERLVYDAMVGDHTLFNGTRGIERLWEVSMPVLKDPPALKPYEPGTWGPEASRDLIAPRGWQLPDSSGWGGAGRQLAERSG